MSNLSVFSFESNQVRVVDVNGEPWFVGKDVAEILGYVNTNKAVSQHCDEEDILSDIELTKKLKELSQSQNGITQRAIYINESGVYSLIFGSEKLEAKAFKKWITSEVLPSIRQTGGYALPKVQMQQLPQRDAIAYIEAATNVEMVNNLTLQELLRNELIDELSVKRGIRQLGAASKEYTIVKVRAHELGYSTEEVGNGSALGRFVAKLVPIAFEERVGKYTVKHYEVNDELDTAIKTYFGMKHAMR